MAVYAAEQIESGFCRTNKGSDYPAAGAADGASKSSEKPSRQDRWILET
jgi:hypothetical protein